MNRLIITTALAAVATWALGATRAPDAIRAEFAATEKAYTNAVERGKATDAFVKAITTDEWRAMADEVVALAATGDAEKRTKADYILWGNRGHAPSVLFALVSREAAKPLAAEYDAKIAEAGFAASLAHYATLPQMAENWLVENVLWTETHPATVAAIRAHKTVRTGDWTLGERLNAFAEAGATGRGGVGNLSKGEVLGAAPKAIKRGLRAKGVTFVAKKGGENPVQKPLDALAAAMNAPRYAGLGAWAEEWCGATWVEPQWLGDDALKTLKDEVLFGERDFANDTKDRLLAHLGVEGYNAFVKEYNGD